MQMNKNFLEGKLTDQWIYCNRNLFNHSTWTFEDSYKLLYISEITQNRLTIDSHNFFSSGIFLYEVQTIRLNSKMRLSLLLRLLSFKTCVKVNIYFSYFSEKEKNTVTTRILSCIENRKKVKHKKEKRYFRVGKIQFFFH